MIWLDYIYNKEGKRMNFIDVSDNNDIQEYLIIIKNDF